MGRSVRPLSKRVAVLLLLLLVGTVLAGLRWWRTLRLQTAASTMSARWQRHRSVVDFEHDAGVLSSSRQRQPVATRFAGSTNGTSTETLHDVAMSAVVFTNPNVTVDAMGHLALPQHPPLESPRETTDFYVFNDQPSFIVTSDDEYLRGKYRLVSIAQHFNKSWGVTIDGVFWTVLNPNPLPRLIYAFDTLTPDDCHALIEFAGPFLERSFVNSHKDGRPEKNPVRTSYGMFMATPDQQKHSVNVKLRRRIAGVVGFPTVAAEATQILKYRPGQWYRPHLDTFRSNNHESLRRGGQRSLTAVTFLNDCGHDPNGGCETTFPVANVSVTPHVGQTVIFYSLREDFATVDRASLHGGSPPKGDEVKFIAVLWFHPRPFV